MSGRPARIRLARAALLSAVCAGAILGALLAGCAEREHLNPLDPENSETGGMIAGFNALAGNAQIEIRWDRLTQRDVAGYRLLRWRPGESPLYLDETYGSGITGTVDSSVSNDETYVYRLVARFTSGDSAISPADSATPGTRRIAVLSAGLPGLVGMTPDARDLLYRQPSLEAYEDMEVDRTRDVLWLTLPDQGRVLRSYFDGQPAGPTIALPGPADVSVSNLRGVGWLAFPQEGVARAFGPDLASTVPLHTIASVGEAHVVEAGTLDPSVWIGNDEGIVLRFTADGAPVGSWAIGARVVAIALDEAMERAWVATRGATGDALLVIDGTDSTVTVLPGGFSNIADLAFEPTTRSLWISDRGPPGMSQGRLSRASDLGVIQMSHAGIEPFGIMADPNTGHCWASELASNRVIEVTPSGTIVRRSAPVDVPYAVRIVEGP